MDCFTKTKRSDVMSRIKSKNTKIELELRKLLWEKGKRYRIHYNVKGKPDIVFPGKKVAIFLDGCFWHKCPKCYNEPKSNKKYWQNKLKRNAERVKEVNAYLVKDGWCVLRFWEHEIKNDITSIYKKIDKMLNKIK